MFAHSLDLVDECGLAQLHVFPFSPRPGTPAARMPQIDRAVIKDRARRLREKGDVALRRHLDREIGTRRRVLAESRGLGHTEQFVPVCLATSLEPGVIVDRQCRRMMAGSFWPLEGDLAMAYRDHLITTMDQLQSLYGEKMPTSILKEIDHINDGYRKLIEAAPFVAVATSGPEGLDCSPKGDTAGFVRILDDKTLAIPDRPGNNR